jgi:hypothetical protein
MTRSLSNLKMVLIATFASLLPLAAVTVSAQQKADVNVPFAFVANQVSLPAGHYQVLASDSSLTFIGADNRRAQALLLTRNEQGDAIAVRGAMKFYVIGNRHVLTEVRFAGSSNRSELLGQPKRGRLEADHTQNKGCAIEIAMN